MYIGLLLKLRCVYPTLDQILRLPLLLFSATRALSFVSYLPAVAAPVFSLTVSRFGLRSVLSISLCDLRALHSMALSMIRFFFFIATPILVDVMMTTTTWAMRAWVFFFLSASRSASSFQHNRCILQTGYITVMLIISKCNWYFALWRSTFVAWNTIIYDMQIHIKWMYAPDDDEPEEQRLYDI